MLADVTRRTERSVLPRERRLAVGRRALAVASRQDGRHRAISGRAENHLPWSSRVAVSTVPSRGAIPAAAGVPRSRHSAADHAASSSVTSSSVSDTGLRIRFVIIIIIIIIITTTIFNLLLKSHCCSAECWKHLQRIGKVGSGPRSQLWNCNR